MADSPLFPAPVVCEAAGITPDKLKNVVSRQPPIILLRPALSEWDGHTIPADVVGGRQGAPNRFTANRVMQVAIMAALADLGWDARDAAEAALRFSDIGGTPDGYWVGEVRPVRPPCQLFPTGQTLLAARPPTATEDLRAEVVNVNSPDDLSRLMDRWQYSATVLDIGPIWHRVNAVLQRAALGPTT